LISEETLKDYDDRAEKLLCLFGDNLVRAQAELVVEGSPVDYDIHEFICSIYEAISSSSLIWLRNLPMYYNDPDKIEFIKNRLEILHLLEEELSSQKDFLDKRGFKQTVHATA